jgi:yecA family protein
MTAALRLETTGPAAEIVVALESALGRSDTVLRHAVSRAGEIAPAVIDVVEQAAAGVYLMPKQRNLLFWGMHVLAAARRTELYRPLLRLLRQCPEDELDELLGDAITQTLGGVVISVCDGDAGPLLQACADKSVDAFARWNLLTAVARLAFDGIIAREVAVEFFDRFEREPLAEPDDDAWYGWQDAVSLLGLEEMRERLRAGWENGRILHGEGDREYIENQLTLAQNLAHGDPSLFVREGVAPIADPVAALAWLPAAEETAAAGKSAKYGTGGLDPAAAVALDGGEIAWLDGFLARKQDPDSRAAVESIEQVDGFFCALLAGPVGARADEFIPVIWSDDAVTDEGTRPAYDSEEQAEYVETLLNRHWRTISLRLERDYPHPPVLHRSMAGQEAGHWAGGFVRGVAARAAAWGERSREEDIASFLRGILAIGTDPEKFPDQAAKPGERAKMLKVLPSALVHLHCLWRGRPSPYRLRGRSETIAGPRIARKIGRNEPCPCGSGKKYKRCCGTSTNEAIEW